MHHNSWTWVGLAGLVVAAVILVLTFRTAASLPNAYDQPRLVYLVLLLVVVGSSVIVGWRGHAALALKQAMIWFAIGLLLVAGYSFRTEFQTLTTRVAGELVPASPVEVARGEISLRARNNGHFYADAMVNGTHVQFVVDTGASDVSLTNSDARRLGIDFSKLTFNRTYLTANGPVQGAGVVLDKIRIGSITVRNVEASVKRGDGLSQSLLGISFLSRLSSVKMDGGRLVMRQ